jgi:hypothetical protein
MPHSKQFDIPNPLTRRNHLNITGKNTEKLLKQFPVALNSLFATAEKVIAVGENKMKFHNNRIIDGVLYLKKQEHVGYWAVSPKDRRLFNTDSDLKEVDIEYDISLFELEAVDGLLQNALNTQKK